MTVGQVLTSFVFLNLFDVLLNYVDTSKEIKYSNWLKYEHLLNRQCLYIRFNDYKWNQTRCSDEKPFICQLGALNL